MKRFLLASSAIALAACGSSAPVSDNDPSSETSREAPAETGTNKLGDLVPWNAGREGVETTSSGLQYLVVSEGPDDAPSPTARDTVQVMYEGRIADTGKKFDSSYDRSSPARFPVDGVIAGWTEGLQLMSEGDEFVFFIPSDLGYGQNPRPGGVIQPGDDLVFHVALQQVEKAPPPKKVDAPAWDKYTPWDSSLDAVQTTESGLEYVVLEEAEGDNPSPSGGDTVVVFYEGRLDETGEVFDSAFKRGEPALFQANRVIRGWSEALGMMQRGDRWLIHLPSELAYGEEGTPDGPIPPDADLNFEVELMDVLKSQ
ncbi:MAG: peptidylprolyl isomerase [Alphaproteobacteria bacterium]|jgi:peptidylprolyl isomerase|nr:peptidylprolyl isomerase [Alphaproteobacteria bacterium]